MSLEELIKDAFLSGTEFERYIGVEDGDEGNEAAFRLWCDRFRNGPQRLTDRTRPGDPPEYVAQVIQAAYDSLRQDEERSAS